MRVVGVHSVPPITIDHVLADRRLGVAEYSVEELPGSDHRAVFAVLVLPSTEAELSSGR